MGLTNKKGARQLRESVRGAMESARGEELTSALLNQFNTLHSQDYFPDKEIEKLLLEQRERELNELGTHQEYEEGVFRFSPSSAGKCERELFYRALKVRQEQDDKQPYHRRWTRNSTAVHEAVQRDLLYSEKLIPNPAFTVERTADNLPAWEKNISTWKHIEHKGVPFILNGMMDGILRYKDGSRIGFEFKTKSTTIAQVGEYKMRQAEESHRLQTVAYSLLFGIDEFLIMYESVAKDSWLKGIDAKPDIRAFYVKVTEEDREALKDKFARVAAMCYGGEVPDGDYSKCIFCPFKKKCLEVA